MDVRRKVVVALGAAGMAVTGIGTAAHAATPAPSVVSLGGVTGKWLAVTQFVNGPQESDPLSIGKSGHFWIQYGPHGTWSLQGNQLSASGSYYFEGHTTWYHFSVTDLGSTLGSPSDPGVVTEKGQTVAYWYAVRPSTTIQ